MPIDAFKVYFQRLMQPAAVESKQEHDIPLITLCLLFEVLRADYDTTSEERVALRNIALNQLAIREDVVDELLCTAEASVKRATCLFEFTRVINEKCQYQDKCRIIGLMWRVAESDHNIHHYEEALIRKVADLIYVSHSDFIRMKHQS